MEQEKREKQEKQDGIRYQVYECQHEECGALDRAKLFPTEEAPLAINCWQCGAGRGMQVPAMRQRGVGMFPSTKPWVDQRAMTSVSTPADPLDSMKPQGDQPS